MSTFTPFDLSCFNRLKERFEFLFEPELINEICRNGQLKSFDDNVLLMDIGQSITHMPLIISGSIKILTEDKDGSELLLYYLELGDTCAVTMNCCTSKSRSTIKGITDGPTEVLFIPVKLMDEWMQKYSTWRAFVLDSYNTRLTEMLSAIDNLAFNNMEERLIKYLVDKAYVLKSHNLPITHHQIANDLHSSRVVISRLMKKLDHAGKLTQHRNRVELLDLNPF